jgi:hypothetical protein
MADVTIKTGDTYPPLEYTLDNDGAPVNLTAADSVRLILKHTDTDTVIEGAANVDDAAAGDVSYDWAAGDTDEAGEYEGEWEVTWDAGATPPLIQTFPNDSYFSLEMKADLD